MFVCSGRCRRPSLVLGACLIDGRNCCRMVHRWAAPHLYYVWISLSWNLEPLRVICTEGGYSGQLHHPDRLNTTWTREQDLKPGSTRGQKKLYTHTNNKVTDKWNTGKKGGLFTYLTMHTLTWCKINMVQIEKHWKLYTTKVSGGLTTDEHSFSKVLKN